MFYNKYLDNDYLSELLENYDNEYLKSINQDNFDEIYNLFLQYNFDYIEEIILKYIDIFEMESNVVETRINNLRKALGDNYVDIIGENISYLEYIARD